MLSSSDSGRSNRLADVYRFHIGRRLSPEMLFPWSWAYFAESDPEADLDRFLDGLGCFPRHRSTIGEVCDARWFSRSKKNDAPP